MISSNANSFGLICSGFEKFWNLYKHGSFITFPIQIIAVDNTFNSPDLKTGLH